MTLQSLTKLDDDPAYTEYQQRVINTLQGMKGNQLKPRTIKSAYNTLKRLNKESDLMNPEAIKLKIADWKLNNQSKQKHLNNYDYFCQANGILWDKPKLKWDTKPPITPTPKQANEIIAAAPTNHAATLFRILLESGFEGEELHNCKETDIDREQGIITVSGNKGHNGRAYKLRPTTTEMLRQYVKPAPQPFSRPEVIADSWRTARTAAAKKTGNTELLKIPLKGLRNLSGIILWQELVKQGKPDPWKIMLHMGHKKMETTQHYLQAMTHMNIEFDYIAITATTAAQRMKAIELNATFIEKDNRGISYYKLPRTEENLRIRETDFKPPED